MLFSLIVPIYNRPDEAHELLDSLAKQTFADFELVLVEDGSDKPCEEVVEKYRSQININYIKKENSGRSYSRNVGMKNAKGDYFVFFDSDCIIPPEYLETVNNKLNVDYADCYGGPDKEHPSFTTMQKAVNYTMTSFWTTGGIRGGKVSMEKFKPRTFNMGFSRAVYEKVGDFKNTYGEDIDLSIRIDNEGFTTKKYLEAFVYHKRRIGLKKFYKQVNIFGHARINIHKLHPGSMKFVHSLPALFVLGSVIIVCLSIFVCPWFLAFPAFYLLLLFIDSLIKTKSISIAGLSIFTSLIQIFGYGFGFISSYVRKVIFHHKLEDKETIRRVYK